MAFFDWKEEYSVGIAIIDKQHRKILELIDELFESIRDSREDLIIKEVLDERNARGDLGFSLSVSLGIASCEPASPCSISDLLTQADERMYRMKRPKL